jgi:pimeloyl-ACP methyl ester carboxylesterase
MSQSLHSKSLQSSNGTRYQISGPADAPVIAFIHGLGLNRRIWDNYFNHFAKHYRVLSYDLYGHGESAAPPYKPSVRQFSEQLIELMDELKIEHCAAIGFSLGGMINRRMAIDHPDRVSALAILNSPHERSEEAQSLVEQRALDSAAGGPGATLDATIERWFTAEFRHDNPGFIEQVRGWVLANEVEIYALCRQVLAFGVVELIRPEPPITHPTLVMTCENDSGSTPAMSQAIASEISGARVVIVPHLKHMGLTENESLFIDELTQFFDTVLIK